MKKSVLFFLLFMPFLAFGQVEEDFSDGDFTINPVWTGTTSSFIVNANFQLQSNAVNAGAHWLFTPSEAIMNAEWECAFLIDYPTSSTNFACFYIISDVAQINSALQGYYVQVGGTEDEVSLYLQQGSRKTKIIGGTDKRTDGRPVNIKVRVTRDSIGLFMLYSRLSYETEWYLEGSVVNEDVAISKYVGISFTNTATTGKLYHFDDIRVSGKRNDAMLPPVGVEAHNPYPGAVVMNEIMFNHADSAAEYIELYNRSDVYLHLSGLLLTTRKPDGTLNSGNTIPPGVYLPPCGYVALTPDVGRLRTYHEVPDSARMIRMGWSLLNNTAAAVVLFDADQRTVLEEVRYESAWHHVMLREVKGVALERIHPDLPADDPLSWHSAAQTNRFGTPGFRNSQYRNIKVLPDDKRVLMVDRPMFSPDGDGIDDFLIIHYSLPEEGWVGTVKVLSPSGENVVKLASGALFGISGHIVWDGRHSTGRMCSVGFYVVVMELFHPLKGKTKQHKVPVVLSSM